MKLFVRLFFVFVLLFALCSCSITQNVSMVGVASTQFTSSEFLENVMSDISSWQENSMYSNAVDEAVYSFAEQLKSTNNAFNVYADKEDENNYIIRFSFSNLEKLLFSLSSNSPQTILSFKKTDNSTRMEFYLDLENYSTLTKIIPILQDPNVEVYGPVYNNPPYSNRTAQEYYKMIDFIFGEGSQSIMKSNIVINFTAPKTIIDTDGTLQGARNVSFTIPLIDFLLLHNPITFYCEY